MVSASQAERDIRKLQESALNDLIDRKLILSEFKAMGGTIQPKYIDDAVTRFVNGRFKGDREAFLKQLTEQGITLNQFRDVQRDQIAVQALQARQTKDNGIGVSLPHERKKMYEKIKHEFATEGQLKLRMLSIPKMTQQSSLASQEKLIKSIRSKVLNGASFSSVAKKYSKDSFAAKGGSVGTIGRNTLNRTLTQIAYSLRTGRVSEVISDGPSWRLMYVDGRVGQKVPSQKEIADEIEKRISIEKRQSSLSGWLTKLRRDSNIRILQ